MQPSHGHQPQHTQVAAEHLQSTGCHTQWDCAPLPAKSRNAEGKVGDLPEVASFWEGLSACQAPSPVATDPGEAEAFPTLRAVVPLEPDQLKSLKIALSNPSLVSPTAARRLYSGTVLRLLGGIVLAVCERVAQTSCQSGDHFQATLLPPLHASCSAVDRPMASARKHSDFSGATCK